MIEPSNVEPEMPGCGPTYPVSDGTPLVPRVSNSSPSGVNFLTVWLPSSTHQTAPSGPIVMPCALPPG